MLNQCHVHLIFIGCNIFDNSAKNVKPLSESENDSNELLPEESNKVVGNFDPDIIVSPNLQNEAFVSDSNINNKLEANTDIREILWFLKLKSQIKKYSILQKNLKRT